MPERKKTQESKKRKKKTEALAAKISPPEYLALEYVPMSGKVTTLPDPLTKSEKVYLLEGLSSAAEANREMDENVYEVLTKIRGKLIDILDYYEKLVS